jgi:hypothetical protein
VYRAFNVLTSKALNIRTPTHYDQFR